MTVPFNFATQSGNIPLSELDANFANVSAHTLTATYVTGNNQPNITGVGSLNSLSVYGNVTAGNVSTNGIVRANSVIGVNYVGTNVSLTGNITGNNIIINGTLEFGNIAANGNVSGGNVLSSGLISAVGNIIGGNVETVNLVVNHISSDDSTYVTVKDGLDVNGDLNSESFNVTGNAVINNLTVTGNFIGTDISVNSIKNGSSNVDITNSNGNVTIGVDGVNNVLVVTSTGAVVAGTIEATDLVVSNITSDGSTAITISNDLSVHGDTDVIGDISATGTVSASGNITGNYYIGNGSLLTGLPVTYSNANVAAYLPTYTGNLVALTGNVTTTANISGAYILGNGSLLTDLPATYGNANVATFLADFGSNVISTTGNVTSGNLDVASGNITGGTVSASGNITGGNLIIPTGKRIYGDFSGSLATRTVFQTSSANSSTSVGAVPSGTATTAGFGGYNSSDVGNAGVLAIVATSSNVLVRSTKTGTASYLPIEIETGGVTRATFDINGNVGIGNTTPVDTLSVDGNAYVSGNITGNYYIGNGSLLTGLPATSYGNANVATFLADFGSNVISTTGNVTSGNLDVASGNITGGNLIIPTGNRIYGDFSGPGTTRTAFQTSSANSSTSVGAVPSGTATTAGFGGFNSSDVGNAGVLAIVATSSSVVLRSTKTGTASYLPISVETGGVTRATFDINGNVGIANTAPADTLSVDGNAYVSGAVKTTPTALANLTAVAGARAFINNANLVASGNFGTLVGSGGSNVVPVWSDGSNWYIG